MSPLEAPSVIVLAAGRSRRMEERNKLLLKIGGRPVLTRVLRAFAEAPVAELIVVTGAQRERVAALVESTDGARAAHNPEFRSGMASSIRRGIRAADPETPGLALCPADLPLLSARTVDVLFRTFAGETRPRIVAPTYEGQQGHPVLFGASFRGALLDLEGDRGARGLLRQDEAPITRVPVPDDGILRDVDTPEALERVRWRVARADVADP
ncbi:MAG: NTP transferase domain-containing protein [Salinibacter sp.]